MTTTATAPKATAAQMIRQILKANFPGTKFSVTSDYNSVNIRYTDGPTSAQVKELCSDFQMGHFNGMEDIYEYSNRNSEVPQVKYVFVERTMSDEVGAEIAKHYGIEDQGAWNESLQAYGGEVIYRKFQETAYSTK